jgi:hypothetical protein
MGTWGIKYCDMMPKIQNLEAKRNVTEASIAAQWLLKARIQATNLHTTVMELLGSAFYSWSTANQHSF